MNDAATGIEEFFRRRYGREAIYLPSGRLALYIAFREWLKPGDRILISPVNDDVVFFTILAAGLTPVLGPVDPSTGNLDPATVDELTWTGLRAVMTTNLYGIPDRMDLLIERCRQHKLLLVEDACQALDSLFGGKRIGEFGSIAAFSLNKHLNGAGGVLVYSEAGRRDVLVQRADDEIRRRTLKAEMAFEAIALLKELADITGTRGRLRQLRARLAPLLEERTGHRMSYQPDAVVRAGRDGGGLDRFDRWVRIDNHYYRNRPPEWAIRRTLRALESFEQNREQRMEGARKLRHLNFSLPHLLRFDDFALLRVPLFVRNRDTVRSFFIRRGVRVDYIYDPPLDVFAPPYLAARIPSVPETILWSRDVLPVEPLQADEFLKLLNESPPLIPAWTDAVQ